MYEQTNECTNKRTNVRTNERTKQNAHHAVSRVQPIQEQVNHYFDNPVMETREPFDLHHLRTQEEWEHSGRTRKSFYDLVFQLIFPFHPIPPKSLYSTPPNPTSPLPSHPIPPKSSPPHPPNSIVSCGIFTNSKRHTCVKECWTILCISSWTSSTQRKLGSSNRRICRFTNSSKEISGTNRAGLGP